MRIAVLSYYSGIHERGVETWAKNLKDKLRGKLEVEIIGGKKSEGVFVFTLRTMNRWVKCDVLVPTNGRAQVLVCRVISFLSGKRVIVFGHSGPGADDKWNLLCSPNVFVAFSDSQMEWAENHKLPWTKVVKIPHGVDTNVFTPAKKKPRGGVVLCVAADIPSKRIDLVRKASERAGMKFVHVGKGGREVSFTDMPKVYRDADVFCFVPRSWEAFGLVYLEAMSANLPVVAIDDPVRREIVGGAGVLVSDPADIDALASAIKDAYARDWGVKPRSQAEKYSWSKIINEYIKLFSNIK